MQKDPSWKVWLLLEPAGCEARNYWLANHGSMIQVFGKEKDLAVLYSVQVRNTGIGAVRRRRRRGRGQDLCEYSVLTWHAPSTCLERQRRATVLFSPTLVPVRQTRYNSFHRVLGVWSGLVWSGPTATDTPSFLSPSFFLSYIAFFKHSKPSKPKSSFPEEP